MWGWGPALYKHNFKSLSSQRLQELFSFLLSLYFQDFETRVTYFPVKYVVCLSLSISLCLLCLFHLSLLVSLLRGQIQRKTWCMGPYAGVDYNLTIRPLQSRLQHIYHGQPYDRVNLNPMPESTLSPVGTLDLAVMSFCACAVIHFFFTCLTPIPFRFVSHEATD